MTKQTRIDFGKLIEGAEVKQILEPRKIFTALPKKHARYNYPRDVQAQVWEQWFERRPEKDLVIKMNTGSGKTTVGLVILKSCLHEAVAPAVYVTPDNYLVDQVMREAKDLGIETTSNENDPAFMDGRSILVINVHKLFNGKSVFGVDREGSKIDIGSIIIDDAHSCLSTVKDQFTLNIPNDHEAFNALLTIFSDDLKAQSPMGLLEIRENDPNGLMHVPFWSWKKKLDYVLAAIHPHRKEERFRFVWPLVAPVLQYSQCVFSGSRIEISPRCLPVDVIPSFQQARRRIYMTATLADDSVLITEFQAEPRSIEHQITPSSSDDLGDRMILIPQEINPDIALENIRKLASTVARKLNVVVIVPSYAKADYWREIAKNVLTATNMVEGVKALREGLVGVTVMVNKYDGVDLPDNACRLLIIDGIPEITSLFGRVENAALDGTEGAIARQVHRIEQGMGRGVRSNEDFCAVLLLGARLCRRLHDPMARSKFTAATKAQIDLSLSLMDQLVADPKNSIQSALKIFFDRDPEWVKTSKAVLVSASPTIKASIDPIAVRRREAFDFARAGQIKKACDAMQSAVSSVSEKRLKGWLKQELAEYTFELDPSEAQAIMLSARGDNLQVLKPIAGISYSRLKSPTTAQANVVADYLKRYLEPNDLIIEVNGLVDDLIFYPETSNTFEAAIQELGRLLGFNTQRPELETGKGPDVLWALGELRYLVIECKNGATSPTISKQDADQLAGSMNWFAKNYDASCKAIPILIHPKNIFDKRASPEPQTCIIEKNALNKLKDEVRSFAKELATNNALSSVDAISDLLMHHRFGRSDFIDAFTVAFKQGPKNGS